MLVEPRLIVADAWSVGERLRSVPRKNRGLYLVTAHGQRFSTRRLDEHSEPFGPMLPAVPEDLQAPASELRAPPVSPGLPIRVGIALGQGPTTMSRRVRTRITRSESKAAASEPERNGRVRGDPKWDTQHRHMQQLASPSADEVAPATWSPEGVAGPREKGARCAPRPSCGCVRSR